MYTEVEQGNSYGLAVTENETVEREEHDVRFYDFFLSKTIIIKVPPVIQSSRLADSILQIRRKTSIRTRIKHEHIDVSRFFHSLQFARIRMFTFIDRHSLKLPSLRHLYQLVTSRQAERDFTGERPHYLSCIVS